MVKRRQAPTHHRYPALLPEGVVGERYRLGDVLGVGGTGMVFEAVDEHEGGAVAVKAIPRDERMQRRARREIRVAQALDHPSIVRLLDAAEDEEYLYVIFELVRGEDLTRVVRDGALDDPALLRAMAAVCDALAHAHAHGVVHRDVKPGNVLLSTEGEIKLTDFGIALIDHPDATVDDRVLGTLSYMSPEQAVSGELDGATDVWAASLMAYEALTGDNPYRARTPQGLATLHERPRLLLGDARPDLPPALARIVERGLSVERSRRPSPNALGTAFLAAARAIETGDVDAMADADLDGGAISVGDRLRRARRALRPRRREPQPQLRAVDPEAAPPAPERLRAALQRAAARAAAAADAARDLEARIVAARDHERFAEDDDADAAATSAWRHVDLRRVAPAVATGLVALPLLSSLAFYPAWWPPLLALGLAALAARAPLAAAALLALLVLPLAGNVSLEAVAPLVLAAAVWLGATAREGRRTLLPAVTIPLAFFLWPLAPLAAASASRAHVRAALGAAMPIAIAVGCGLAGATSPLTGQQHGAGLAATLAASTDPLTAGRLLADALGPAVLVQSVAWAILAVTARPLLTATGPVLRWHAAIWLAVGFAASVLGPTLAGAPAVPIWPAATGTVLAGILIGARSVASAEARGLVAPPA